MLSIGVRKQRTMQVYQMYDGAVELTFDEAKHVYRANGEIVEGATTVLKCIAKPALIYWSANMAAEFVGRALKPGVSLDEVEIANLVEGAKKAHRVKADQSANLGNIAHGWFDDHFSGRAPATPVNPELRKMTEAFLRFAASHNLEILETERRLYSREHKFAGTTDLICKLDGELTIGDYKTGKSGLYPEHMAQLGGYDIAFSEETKQTITRHLLINCNAKGELFVAVTDSTERNRSAFLAALTLSRTMKEIAPHLKDVTTSI